MNKEIKDYGEAYETLQNIMHECNRLKMYIQKETAYTPDGFLDNSSKNVNLVSVAAPMIKNIDAKSGDIDIALLKDLSAMYEEQIEDVLMKNESLRYAVEQLDGNLEDYTEITASDAGKIHLALDAVNERLGEPIPLQDKRDYYSKEDMDTMRAVLESVMYKPYSELNKFMGSETIQRAAKLRSKMEHEEYCEKRGMKYEDMTEEDFEMKAEEDIRQAEIEAEEYDDYE
jgi:hypothetical protein